MKRKQILLTIKKKKKKEANSILSSILAVPTPNWLGVKAYDSVMNGAVCNNHG